MNNKKLFKNLLATASTVAVLATGVSAIAADFITTGPVADTSGANVRNAAGAAPAPVPATNSTIFLGAAHDLTLDVATSANNSHTVNLYGNDGQTLSINKAVTFSVTNDITATATAAANAANAGAGAVAAGAAGAAAKAIVNFTAAVDATLSSGLANISSIDFGANDQTLTLGAGTYKGNLLATGNAGTGTLKISSDVVFDGTKSDVTNIKEITIDAGKTLTLQGVTDLTSGNVITNGITVNGTLDVGAVSGAVKIDHADAIVNLNGGTVTTLSSTNAANGKVFVNADSTVGELGNANAVASVKFTGDHTLTLGNGGAHNVGAITTANEGEGVLAIGTTDVTSTTVGALKLINFAANDQNITVTGTEFKALTVTSNNGAADGVGTLTFEDEVSPAGSLGTEAYRLKSITGGTDKSDIDLTGAALVNVNNLTLSDADAKMKFSSDTVVGKIALDASNLGDGKFTVVGDKSITFTDLGKANALGELTIDSGLQATVEADAKLAKLIFGANSTETSSLTAKTLNNITSASTEVDGNGILRFTDDSTLNGAFGADGKKLSALILDGDVAKTLDVNNQSVFAAIKSEKADKLTVTNLGKAAEAVQALGSAEARLASVTLNADDLDIAGEVFSKEIHLGANTYNFKESVHGGLDKNGKIDSKLNIVDGTTVKFSKGVLDININTAVADKGDVVFLGDQKVSSNIGTNAARVKSVSFGDAGKTVQHQGDVYTAAADDSIVVKGTLDVTGKSTFDGKVKFDNATVSLTDHDLKLEQDSKISGTLNLTTVYKGQETRHIDADGKALALDKGIAVTIKGGTVANGSKIERFFNFTDSGKEESLAKFSDANSSSLTKWTFVKGEDDNKVNLVATNDVDNFKKKSAEKYAMSGDAITLIGSLADKVGSLSKSSMAIVNAIADQDENGEKAATEVKKIVASSDTSSMLLNMSDDASSVTSSRLSSVGVASGDEDSSLGLGVWAKGSASKATQKARKGNVGYKTDSFAGTVGVDTMVNDSTILGVSATFAKTNAKFKDIRSGDKLKSDNMFFNVYASHDITSNWFVKGLVGFGKGNVKQKSQRAVSEDFAQGTVEAKYDVTSINLEALAGYRVNVTEDLAFVPTAGIKYSNVNEGGYTEKGALLNKTVTKKSADRFSVVAGATVSTSMDMGFGYLTPSAHAFVNLDLKNNAKSSDVKIDGADAIKITSGKADKVSYKLGFDLDAKADMVDYGIGYEAKLANKFVSHQGSLRLRVSL